MPNRSWPIQTAPDNTSSGTKPYAYGFNGKESDFEVKNIEGSQQDYGLRIYDPRLGKFLSVDPLTSDYPWYTPYQFAGNKPIQFIDIDGGEEGSPPIPFFEPLPNQEDNWDYVRAVPRAATAIVNGGISLLNNLHSSIETLTYSGLSVESKFENDLPTIDEGIHNVQSHIAAIKSITLADIENYVSSPQFIEDGIVLGFNAYFMTRTAPASPVPFIMTEEAVTTEVALQPYGGPGGGHHIPAKSAFIGDPVYRVNAAPAIPNVEMARLGINHGVVTGAQMVAYKAFATTGKVLTWYDMSVIETNALIKGGLGSGAAAKTVNTAITNLQNSGVNPARIPWGPR